MKAIRDPIHGYIDLDPIALALIDTPPVQRLRRISQLGLSNLVYPGANHTRFEHSLGVMHLTGLLTSRMDSITKDEKDELRVAALIHDIGHGPLSHVTEGLVKHYTRHGHEDIRWIIKKGEIAEILSEHGINPTKVEKHIKGQTDIGKILNSEIDVDKMDYLVRDSHYTGVAFGIVDHARLINEMQFYENQLVVATGGVKAAESLLFSRFLMYPSVYYHHVSRIAETMFVRAVEDLIHRGLLDPLELRMMDDARIFEKIRNNDGYARELAVGLDGRKLYKRAIYVGLGDVGESVLKQRKNVKRMEAEIAEMVGIDSKEILIDIPKDPEIVEMKALVKINGRMLRLDETSHMVATLEKAHKDNWRMGVYTTQENRERVAKVAREFFEVKKSVKQFRLNELE